MVYFVILTLIYLLHLSAFIAIIYLYRWDFVAETSFLSFLFLEFRIILSKNEDNITNT
jgi:hypothetical protein